MNKKNLRGFKSVFTFTFTQFIKSKSFKIICIILAVIALASFPILTLIQKSGEKELVEVKYDTVYVSGADESFAKAVEAICKEDELLGNVKFVFSEKIDELEKELEEGSKDNYMVMKVDLMIPMISIVYGDDTEVDSEQAGYLADFIYENSIRLNALYMGLDESKINALTINIYDGVNVIYDTEEEFYLEDDKESFGMNEFTVTYVFLVVVLLFIVFSGEAVAMSIITEKSSKVVEYLMVSIKPMALILGKVVAMLLAVMTQMCICGVCIIISSVINGFIFTNPDGSYGGAKVLEGIKDLLTLDGLNPVNVIVAIVIVLLGFLGYGMLAGLAGATVSKVEEAAEGMKIFTFAMLIGAYLCMIYINVVNAGSSWGTFDNIVYMLPLSSPFIVPSFLLMGKISLSTALIAAAILILAIAILISFVSKVYEYLIYYKGDPVKIKKLIEIAKNAGGKGRREASHEK